jgi:hypothetical protein
VTGAAGAVSDFIDAYNDFQGSHYGDVAQDLVHGMKSFQSTLKACKKQNWCATNPDRRCVCECEWAVVRRHLISPLHAL